jgi:DNA-binding response OmpR family regulator
VGKQQDMEKESRILVIDDDTTNLSYLSELLGKSYDLRTSVSGEEGLRTAESFKPDLILLDIMMPGIDGYAVCEKLRSHKALSRTKIIFLSARVQMSEKLKGYRVGGDDYITKPFDNDEVQAKIKVFLRLKYEEEIRSGVEVVPDSKLLGILYKTKKNLVDIIYIKSDSPYCKVYFKALKKEPDKIRVTIRTLEEYFKSRDLLRVHRSYLVNPRRILSINKQKNNELKLLVQDSKSEIAMIPIGRSYHKCIKAALPHLFPW